MEKSWDTAEWDTGSAPELA